MTPAVRRALAVFVAITLVVGAVPVAAELTADHEDPSTYNVNDPGNDISTINSTHIEFNYDGNDELDVWKGLELDESGTYTFNFATSIESSNDAKRMSMFFLGDGVYQKNHTREVFNLEYHDEFDDTDHYKVSTVTGLNQKTSISGSTTKQPLYWTVTIDYSDDEISYSVYDDEARTNELESNTTSDSSANMTVDTIQMLGRDIDQNRASPGNIKGWVDGYDFNAPSGSSSSSTSTPDTYTQPVAVVSHDEEHFNTQHMTVEAWRFSLEGKIIPGTTAEDIWEFEDSNTVEEPRDVAYLDLTDGAYYKFVAIDETTGDRVEDVGFQADASQCDDIFAVECLYVIEIWGPDSMDDGTKLPPPPPGTVTPPEGYETPLPTVTPGPTPGTPFPSPTFEPTQTPSAGAVGVEEILVPEDGVPVGSTVEVTIVGERASTEQGAVSGTFDVYAGPDPNRPKVGTATLSLAEGEDTTQDTVSFVVDEDAWWLVESSNQQAYFKVGQTAPTSTPLPTITPPPGYTPSTPLPTITPPDGGFPQPSFESGVYFFPGIGECVGFKYYDPAYNTDFLSVDFTVQGTDYSYSESFDTSIGYIRRCVDPLSTDSDGDDDIPDEFDPPENGTVDPNSSDLPGEVDLGIEWGDQDFGWTGEFGEPASTFEALGPDEFQRDESGGFVFAPEGEGGDGFPWWLLLVIGAGVAYYYRKPERREGLEGTLSGITSTASRQISRGAKAVTGSTSSTASSAASGGSGVVTKAAKSAGRGARRAGQATAKAARGIGRRLRP